MTDMNKCAIQGKTKKSETDLITHVLATLPENYKVTVNKFESKMEAYASAVTIQVVCEKLALHYERIKDHTKVTDR